MAEDYKRKIGDAVDEHKDTIDKGLDKAAEAADKRTGGKYGEQISSGVDKSKEFLDGLSGDEEQPGDQEQDQTDDERRRER